MGRNKNTMKTFATKGLLSTTLATLSAAHVTVTDR